MLFFKLIGHPECLILPSLKSRKALHFIPENPAAVFLAIFRVLVFMNFGVDGGEDNIKVSCMAKKV